MEFMTCSCDRRTLVFTEDGVFHCVNCFKPRAAEAITDPSLQDVKLAAYVDGLETFLTPDKRKRANDICWLSAIFPLARSTSGNWNCRQRVFRCALVLYKQWSFNMRAWSDLECHAKGVLVFRSLGPVPGVALYFNRSHCSDRYFPGSMWVATNLPLMDPIYFPTGIDCGSELETTLLDHNGWFHFMGHPVRIEGTELTVFNRYTYAKLVGAPLPHELRGYADRIRRAWPEDTPFPASWASKLERGGISLGIGGYGLDFRHGCCWAAPFGNLAIPFVEFALNRGMLNRHGIEGGLLNRFTAAAGIRFVRVPKEQAEFVLSNMEPGHWLHHLGVDGSDQLPNVVCYLRVEPNFGDLTERPSFRFDSLWRIGFLPYFEPKVGKHSPPGDGGCGLNCLQVAYRVSTGKPVRWDSYPLGSNNWLDDNDMAVLSQYFELGGSVARNGAGCPRARFWFHHESNHWTLEIRKVRRQCLDYTCSIGACFGKCKPPAVSATPIDSADEGILTFDRIYAGLKAGKTVTAILRGLPNAQILAAQLPGTPDSIGKGSVFSFTDVPLDDEYPKVVIPPKPMPRTRVPPVPAPRKFPPAKPLEATIAINSNEHQLASVESPVVDGADVASLAGPPFAVPGSPTAIPLSEGGSQPVDISTLRAGLIEDQEHPSNILSNLGRYFWKGSKTPDYRPLPQEDADDSASAVSAPTRFSGDDPDRGEARFDVLRTWLKKRMVFSRTPRSLASVTQLAGMLQKPGTVPINAHDLVGLVLLVFAGLGSLVLPWFWLVSLLAVFLHTPRGLLYGFTGLLGFTVTILSVDTRPTLQDCDAGLESCRPILLSYILHRGSALDLFPTLGVLGVMVSAVARVVGGSTIVYAALLRISFVLDLLLLGGAFYFSGLCTRCWGYCIRTAHREVTMNSVPMSKIGRQALTLLCDTYCQPPVDFIKLATGYSGCFCGTTPIATHGKCVPYAKLDKNKIGNGTLIPPPVSPNQAKQAIEVILNGGSFGISPLPPVQKVTTVPFKSVYFPPHLPVDATKPIVVDQTLFSHFSPEQRSMVVLGSGDFVAVNRVQPPELDPVTGAVWADKILTPARRAWLTTTQIQRLTDAGYAGALTSLYPFWYSLICLVIGVFLQQPSVCGVGTNDRFCRDPFSRPVQGYEGYCAEGYCLSSAGLASAAASTLTTVYGVMRALAVGTLLLMVCCRVLKITLVELGLLMLPFLGYVHPWLVWLSLAFPFTLWHGVNTLVLGVFLTTLAFIEPAAMLLSTALCLILVLARFVPGVPHVVTPYDLGKFVTNPRNASAVSSAVPGSHIYAMRTAALTGKNLLYIPNAGGITLEGIRRKRVVPHNIVTVCGGSAGVGSLWRIDGRNKVITASHLLEVNEEALVTLGSAAHRVVFTCRGDFAIADSPFTGFVHPEIEEGTPEGVAYWLTSSGTEVGFVRDKICICYTDCGDSGSPVLNAKKQLLGVHTGSNKRGLGVLTKPNGTQLGYGRVALSDLAQHFDGDHIPVGEVPANVIKDMDTAPASLVKSLTPSYNLEGALPVISVLVAFVTMWRLVFTPFGVPVLAAFFLLNEILPVVLMRMLFGLMLDVVQICVLNPGSVFAIKLLTASLHHNTKSLVFWVLIGTVSFYCDGFTCNYLITQMVPHNYILCGLLVVHLSLLLCRWLCPSIPQLYYCEGHFSRAFLARLMMEGLPKEEGVRTGVSASTLASPECLAAALATSFTEEDLAFMRSHADAKCVKSAINLRTAANDYIESSFAKSLMRAMSGVQCKGNANPLLARLSDFAANVTCTPDPGDKVILIGQHPQCDYIEYDFGGQTKTLALGEQRHLAGTLVTVATCIEHEGGSIETAIVNGRRVLVINGKPIGLEEDPDRRASESIKRCGPNVDINGVSYAKMWNTKTGDVYYVKADHAAGMHTSDIVIGKSTIGRAARNDNIYEEGNDRLSNVSRLSIDEAMKAMGLDTTVGQADLTKLDALIGKLMMLRDSGKALNCSGASVKGATDAPVS